MGMRTSPSMKRWSQIQQEQIHTGTVLISIHEQMISDTRKNKYIQVEYSSPSMNRWSSDTARTNTYRYSTYLHPWTDDFRHSKNKYIQVQYSSPSMNIWSQTQQEQIHTGTVLIPIDEQMISDTARTNTYRYSTHLHPWTYDLRYSKNKYIQVQYLSPSLNRWSQIQQEQIHTGTVLISIDWTDDRRYSKNKYIKVQYSSPSMNRWSQIQKEQIHTGPLLVLSLCLSAQELPTYLWGGGLEYGWNR